jgi:hypothetical protein
MARTVRNQRRQITFNNRTYGMLMKLAFDGGWRPIGCLEPEGWTGLDAEGKSVKFFSMDYFGGRGQRVQEQDALAIAQALETAMDDIPQFDALGFKVQSEIRLPGQDQTIRQLRPGAKVNPFEFFSGRGREAVLAFAEFCREGAYSIHA